MDNATSVLRDKLAMEEITESELGHAYAEMLRASKALPWILDNPHAWMDGFLGYAADVFRQQDKDRPAPFNHGGMPSEVMYRFRCMQCGHHIETPDFEDNCPSCGSNDLLGDE